MIDLFRPQKWIYLFLLAFAVLLSTGSVRAEQTPLFGDRDNELSLTSALRLYETPSNIEPIQNINFEKIINESTRRTHLHIVEGDTDYWFYGEFKTAPNLVPKNAALVIDHPYPRFDSVTLVLNPGASNQQTFVNGRAQKLSDRSFDSRLMAFELELVPDKTYQFLIKVNSLAKQPFGVSLETERHFLKTSGKVEFAWGIFFGMFFIAAIYNLLIYSATQQKVYIYYVLFIAATGLAQAAITGHGLHYLWPESTNWNLGVNLFFIGFSAIFGILFTQSFLNTKYCAPTIHQLLNVTHIPSVLIVVLSQTLRYDVVTTLMDLTLLWLLILMMSAGVISYRSGEKTARFFLLGWGSLLTCMAIYIAMMRGYIDANGFTLFTPQIGSILEITIITMAVADRIRQDRRDKTDALALQKSAIGQLQSAEEALLQQAMHDPVTGLANQNLLDRAIHNALHSTDDDEIYLVLIKIKDLREINNTLGRYVGDEVARFTAKYLREAIDQIPQQFIYPLCRGGDKLAVIQGVTFAYLIKSPNDESAINLVKNIQVQLPRHFELNSISLEIETYAGICSAAQAQHQEDIWLRNAFVSTEQALQFSNQCQIYDDTYNPYSERRLSLISDLKKAVEQDELQIYLQPQLDARTQSIVSAEALLRWIHPQHGFVPPDEFIALAEDSGVIKPLTRWVILHSVKALQTLHKLGYFISLSINVSPQNLEEEDLTAYIVDTLSKHSIDPTYLTFEMTETAMLANPELASNVLNQWNKMGLSTAIDDFGTGYSSLSHLKRLPMRELKIDRSFIKDMLSSEEDKHIVQATLTIGHSLGMRVVAEGVEDEELLTKLAQLECDIIQGYHLSRPLSLDDFIAWLQDTKYAIGRPKLRPVDTSQRSAKNS